MASKIVVDRINEVAITPPATGATITIADGKTLTVTDDATISGTNTGDEVSATTSVEGIVELATNAESLTGTDTSRATTPAGVAGAMAVQTNPLAKSQGVHLTESGTVGAITVADNNNIDFGTGNYTLVWRGALPDWTPSATVRLLDKHDATNGYRPQITTGGKLRLYVNDGSDIDITSTSALGFVDGTEHELAIVVTRNSSVAMYADGKLIHTASITESPIVTVSNAVPLYVLGTSATRFVSDNKSVYTYNRALTASEVLDLYRNGIAYADKWGSQTEQTSGTLTVGKRYRINNWITDDDFTNIGGTNEDGNEFIATGTTPTKWTNSSTVVPIGATLALEPEGIQTDKWYDSSTNLLNATYPASGSSLLRKDRPFQEQGTWVPLVKFGGNAVDLTYNESFHGGFYKRIGNMVVANGMFIMTAKGSSSGNATIAGLPFTSGASWGKSASVAITMKNVAFANQYSARVGANASVIDLYETAEAGTRTAITNADFSDTAEVYLSVTYFID